jgi:hypothetical protein
MQVERCTFASERAVRVVLLPVGPISASLFEYYAGLLEKLSVVQLCDVTRDPTDRTALQHQKWTATAISFCFLRDMPAPAGEALALREDLRNELESFQAHKRIVCAIGILHCPSSPDAKSDYAAFQQSLFAKYPGVAVQRCFAMEKNPADAVTAPEMMEIPVCDEEKTRFYFNTLMHDFTYAVLRSFEVEFARKVVSAPLVVTPMDADLQERTVKALQLGRLNKLKGDYALLAGSPGDAVLFYESAKVECKKQSDIVWLGGALEGYAAALLLLGKDEAEALACMQDAMLNYSKGKALALELEALLKLAHFRREKGEALEACSLLMSCHALAQPLSAQNKVVLLTTLCFEFQSMGLYRKFAFFLRELATLYEQLQMHGTRERILLLGAPFYQLHELGPPLDESVKMRWGECAVGKRNGWGLLSALTLLELAKVAEARDDSVAYARYITYMLRLFPNTTSAKTQKDLASLLLGHTRRLLPCVSLDMTGLPLVASVKIIPAQNVATQVAAKNGATGSAGSGAENNVFIFNPSAAKLSATSERKWEEAVWVRGEVATARVTLVNEREFPIQIERIRLCTRGVAFEPFTTSMNVPAKSTKVVDLSGLPVGEPGFLLVTGVEIQAFHVVGMHRVDSFGQSLEDARTPEERVEDAKGPLRVRVTDPLPQMNIDSVLFNGNHLQILEGVKSQATITLENTGKVPVTWISLTVSENLSLKPGVFAERRAVFSWREDTNPEMLLAAPLLPGETHHLVMDTHGLAGTIGATITIQYGGAEVQFFRKEMHHIPIFVTKGLELTAFAVEQCAFDAAEMPAVFRLKHDAHLRGKPLVLLLFHVTNSAKAAFAVQPRIRGESEFVTLEAADSIVVAPNSTRVIGLPMARLWIPDEELEELPKRQGQFIRVRPEDVPTPEQAHAQRLEYNFKRLLQRTVRLDWTSTSNQCGALSLASCTVTMDTVRKMLLPPLEFAFGDSCERVSYGAWRHRVAAGSLVTIECTVQNKTQGELMGKTFGLKLLDLKIEEAILGGLLCVSGSLTREADLRPGETRAFVFKLCALLPLVYRFELCCCNDPDLTSYSVAPQLLLIAE